MRTIEDTHLGALGDLYASKIPLQVLEQLAQSAFAGEPCQYNPDWATNGWYTDCVPVTIDSIVDDVVVWLTNDDEALDEDRIREIVRYNVGCVTTWNQNWTHESFAGNNLTFFLNQIIAALNSI